MSKVVREDVTSGGESVGILIEVDEEEAWEGHVSFGKRGSSMTRDLGGGPADAVTEGVTDLFSRGMKLIRTCAEKVSETVRQVSGDARPQEGEVKFGVKLSGETGAIIAKTGTEAQMEVTLRWTEKA